MAVLVEQDVGRLDVAVHEAAPVSGVECLRDRAENVEPALRRKRALALERTLEIAAVDQPHRQEELSLVSAGRVDRDDVRVVEGRRDARSSRKRARKCASSASSGATSLSATRRPSARSVAR